MYHESSALKCGFILNSFILSIVIINFLLAVIILYLNENCTCTGQLALDIQVNRKHNIFKTHCKYKK